MIHYVIQENLFREDHYKMLISSLERISAKYTVVRIFPFVDKIVDVSTIPLDNYELDLLEDFNPSDDKIFIFGALKLSRIALERGWKPGSLMNSNHDFIKYKEYYKDNLLNYDSLILSLGESIEWVNHFDLKFIRPTKDSKSFAGNVFSYFEWEDLKENYLHNYRSSEFNENTQIQVSTVKKIKKEFRFWIIDGKVVTGSQYRMGSFPFLSENIDDDAISFVEEMVDVFQLAEAFVMDVALTDWGWKIIECGCINCAGFYRSDIQKILFAIEDKFN